MLPTGSLERRINKVQVNPGFIFLLFSVIIKVTKIYKE